MSFKRNLTAATALTLLTGAALADGNKAYTLQEGQSNVGTITQSGDRNQAGREPALARISQDGRYNLLTILQSGDDNKVGVAASNNLGVDQKSRDNTLDVVQSGNLNTIRDVTQYGRATGGAIVDAAQVNTATLTQTSDSNTLTAIVQKWQGSSTDANAITVLQAGSGGHAIARLDQDGAGNTLDITQNGSGNKIGSVEQGRYANVPGPGLSSQSFGGSTRSVSSTATLTQDGIGNEITKIQQYGRNHKATITQNTGDNLVSYLGQAGDGNIATIDQTGRFNTALSTQIGDGNLFDLDQDSANGAGNEATVSMIGNLNDVSVSQTSSGGSGSSIATVNISGDRNNLAIDQQDAGGMFAASSITVDIYGSDNNNGPGFTGVALSGALPEGLVPGDLVQRGGSGNTMSIDVGGIGNDANGNQFAMLQNGSNNTITGAITGAANQIVVVQNGNGNGTNFVQSGNGNSAFVSQ